MDMKSSSGEGSGGKTRLEGKPPSSQRIHVGRSMDMKGL
jgi:hypothetical protein